MEKFLEEHLLALNARFYRENAAGFSATRQRLQPGVQRVVAQLLAANPPPRLLDLGCGNGQLARYLVEQGYRGNYLGLDASQELLADARQASPFRFIVADLASPDWDSGLGEEPFDAVLAFAVLHHLPGARLRLEVLKRARNHLVKPSGVLIHSEWQISSSPRLVDRIRPWEEAGLNPTDVDLGDLLVDWRAPGQPGLRYVHQFSESELSDLAAAAQFRILETFYSDGREHNLGLYQLWIAS